MTDKFEDEAASIIKQAAPQTGMEVSGCSGLVTGRLQELIAMAIQSAEVRGYYHALKDAGKRVKV